MSTNHTPGPWEYSRMLLPLNAKDRRSGFVVNGPDTGKGPLPVRVCDLRVPLGIAGFAEGEANARLIAAAPDLLAALRECITENGATCFARDSKEYMKRRLDSISAIACAAIAKAEGC